MRIFQPAILSILLFVMPSGAQQVVIDFDDLVAPPQLAPPPLYVSNQYASLGVIFSSNYIGGMGVVASANAVSGANLAYATNTQGAITTAATVQARFELFGQPALVDNVSVNVPSATATLQAYGANGQFITSTTGGGIISVTAVGSIARVVLQQSPRFDDFRFTNIRIQPPSCAAGNIGGASSAPQSVLFVQGTPDLFVTSPLGQSIVINVTQPVGVSIPAGFVLFGAVGPPQFATAFTTPWGEMCFPPALALPAPGLFVLANTFVPGSGFAANAAPAPWSFATPPVNTVFDFGLQAIVQVSALPTNNLAISNYVAVQVR